MPAYMERKKVLILSCGGLALGENAGQKELDAVFQRIFQLQMVADIQTQMIWPGAGTDISLEIWDRLAKAIAKNASKYHGFIVIHGIDNVLYTSALLSFLFQHLGKPIVFLGPNGREWGSNMDPQGIFFELSLLNAVALATIPCAETMLFYGTRVIRATRGRRDTNSELNPFAPYKMEELANTQLALGLSSVARRRASSGKFFTEFSKNVKILEFHPGNEIPENLERFDGIALKGYREKLFSENFPQLHIPVMLYTEEERLSSQNVIIVSRITWEAALMKFLWALGQTKNMDELRAMMQTDYVGEKL